MVTPPKGDTSSVPLNAAGRKAADAWDLNADRARGALCKAFGPPGLIRQPGRVRIRWENDNTLLLEFDAGTQVRRFRFGASSPAGARSLQGDSEARWFRQPQNRGIFAQGAPTPGGSLEVVTTNLQAGYLRPNGVPYSDRAVVKEFFDSFTLADDGTWLIVTTVVSDPALPDAGIRDQLAVQEGNRSVQMESPARARFRRPRCRRKRGGGSERGRIRRAATHRRHFRLPTLASPSSLPGWNSGISGISWRSPKS